MAGLFNVVVLEVFRSSALQYLQTSVQTAPYCSAPAGTPQNCFDTILTADIPALVMFPIAVLGILFGALYGLYYEFLPGHGYPIKALAMGLSMFIVMIFFAIAGNASTTDQTQLSIVRVFDLVAMLGYTLIIARFYRRFTREVRFESSNPQRLKITVDRKNYTGKVKTLAVKSTHTVRAPSESGAFHEWLVSGGVSVLDSKSFETTMRVDGDGLLKIT